MKTITKQKLPPIHPGEILLEEFMKPLGLTQNALGHSLGVSPRRINEIVHGKRAISADTALRLARFFRTTPEFWMGLQSDYEIRLILLQKAKQIELHIHPCSLKMAA